MSVKYHFAGFHTAYLYAGRNDYGKQAVIISCLFSFKEGGRKQEFTGPMAKIKKKRGKNECHRQQNGSTNWWTNSTSTAMNTTTRMHPAFQMQFTTAFMMSWSFGRKIRASS